MESGYKTMTPVQLAGVLGARRQGEIGAEAVRVFFACLAAVAVREAAERRQRKKGTRSTPLKRCYRHDELASLTSLSMAKVRRALRELERAAVLECSEAEIRFGVNSPVGSEELQAALAGKRSEQRPVPVPRRLLRFLARNTKEALTLVMCGYMMRGLSITRRTGKIGNKGTVKASWLAETFGISLRAVRYAQSELRRVGWIGKDRASHQNKLNRDGAYFVINLDWIPGKRESADTTPKLLPDMEGSIMNRDKTVVSIAPLPAENGPRFAPPNKDRETSNESKNQETLPLPTVVRVPTLEAGVCLVKKEGERSKDAASVKEPSLRNIQSKDLCHFGRLESLYAQAVCARWIAPGEASALNFIAAAVRAREVGRDPARVFVSLVKRKLWTNITQAQEDRARTVLNKFREENPDRFRLVRETGSERRWAA